MIAVAECNVNLIGRRIQCEGVALIAAILQRDASVRTIPASAGDGSAHPHRAAELFRARCDVQGVEVERAAVGNSQYVHGSRGDVDDGSAGDADRRRDAFDIITRGGDSKADLPQRRALLVCVEGVDRIILRGDEHDVVICSLDAQLRDVQGLGINLTVHWIRTQFAELR